jgi:hypothetical protein
LKREIATSEGEESAFAQSTVNSHFSFQVNFYTLKPPNILSSYTVPKVNTILPV